MAKPEGWRLWLIVLLWALFPIVFHPWWLLLSFLAAYCFLVWLLLSPNEGSS